MYRLKELRVNNNLGQKDIAKLLGVKKSSVSNWELGKTSPDLHTLLKLSKYFDVSTDYLLENSNFTKTVEQEKKALTTFHEDINSAYDSLNSTSRSLIKLMIDFEINRGKNEKILKNLLDDPIYKRILRLDKDGLKAVNYILDRELNRIELSEKIQQLENKQLDYKKLYLEALDNPEDQDIIVKSNITEIDFKEAVKLYESENIFMAGYDEDTTILDNILGLAQIIKYKDKDNLEDL